MSYQELINSIEEYNTQLIQVGTALQQEGLAPKDEQELKELQENLMQLLELTLDQVQQLQQTENESSHGSSSHKQLVEEKTEEELRLEQELALFNSEIAELEEDTPEGVTDATCAYEDTSSTASSSFKQQRPSRDGSGYINHNKQHSNRTSIDGVITLNSEGSTSDNETDSSDYKNSTKLKSSGEDSTSDVTELLCRKHPSHGGFVKAWTVEELLLLEGAVVRAPFMESWGGHTYHNALIMSVNCGDTDDTDVLCPEVVVLFSQPTCLSMLPCRYFLSATCHYMDGSCQYSHGYNVEVDSLRPYCAPEASAVQPGAKVLCRHKQTQTRAKSKKASQHPELWHTGTVEDVLHDQKILSVDCAVCGDVVQCDMEQVVAILEDRGGGGGGGGDGREFKLSDVRRISATPEEDWGDGQSADHLDNPATSSAQLEGVTQQWLLHPTAGGKLGEWEKYTRGIGSRLMQAMGYISGSGLGRDGSGRVEPVPAYLYPAGVSLDRCMELREKSGGEDLLQVEKRLVKQQQKEEKRLQREEERIMSQTSVFDIINNQLAGPSKAGKKTGSGDFQEQLKVGRQHLQADTAKALNMKGYQLSSRVKHLQREVEQLTHSRDRQGSKDRLAAASINCKLQEKQEELSHVLKAEQRVSCEQQTRQDKKKFVVF